MLQAAESTWIEPLVHELYRPVFQLAYLLVRDYAVAQDIVQEAFVRVWLSLEPQEKSMDSDPGFTKRWLTWRATIIVGSAAGPYCESGA